MDVEYLSSVVENLKEIPMKDNGKVEKGMVKQFTIASMVTDMKENSEMARRMGKESIIGQIKTGWKDSLKMVSSVGKLSITTQMGEQRNG